MNKHSTIFHLSLIAALTITSGMDTLANQQEISNLEQLRRKFRQLEEKVCTEKLEVYPADVDSLVGSANIRRCKQIVLNGTQTNYSTREDAITIFTTNLGDSDRSYGVAILSAKPNTPPTDRVMFYEMNNPAKQFFGTAVINATSLQQGQEDAQDNLTKEKHAVLVSTVIEHLKKKGCGGKGCGIIWQDRCYSPAFWTQIKKMHNK